MKRIRWAVEEAVALYSLCVKFGFRIPEENLKKLSAVLNKRANMLDIEVDDKFRNVTGLNMQAACIEYAVTNGKSGLSSVNKLFYDVDDLYKNDNEKFCKILNEFVEKYGEF